MLSWYTTIIRLVILSTLLLCTAVLASDEDVALEQALDSYVQKSQTDSNAAKALLNELFQNNQTNPAIKSRVRLYSYMVTDAYNVDEPQKAEPFLQALLQLAEITENPDALSEIYGTEIEVLRNQRKLNEAILKADQLDYYLQRANDPRIRYFFNMILGQLYVHDLQYSKALQHYIAALDAVMETDNEATLRRRTVLNINIANVHAELKNWPQARELARSTLEEAKKYQLTGFITQLYLLQGYIEGSDRQIAKAIEINHQGLAVALQENDEYTALTFENNLGSSYIDLEQYDSAKAILMQALERAERLKDEYSVELIKFNLGFIRVVKGEHQAGLAQMNEGMVYFSKHDSKAQFETSYEWLAKAYAAAGMYQQQADILLEQMALREHIRSTEKESRLNELQNRFDSKAKAQQITILEQENKLNVQLLENQRLQQKLIWLVVVIIVFASVMLLQLYRRVRRSNKKLHESNKLLAYQSQRDVLTGLYNRRALQEYLQKRALKRREQDVSIGLTGFLLLDIDFFKRINDHYGHAAGDVVLQHVSQRLLDTCRDKDIVVRWGGEEMLLVLDNIDPAHVGTFIKRVLDAIGDSPIEFDGQQISVTASGGFIHLPFAGISEEQLDWEKVLQIADMALYLSKSNGRNQACLVEGLAVSFAEAEAQLYSDLASAIRDDHVQVSTVTGPGGNVS